ncbi:MAG: MATE family efflux transporter [Chloroflexota bacterium]
MDFNQIKHVAKLAWPVVLTNLLQTSVSVVDTFMVGRLGPISIAAVGMGNTLRLLVFVLLLSVSAGGMSLIAQAKGARDPQRMSVVARQSITSGVMLSLILTILGYTLSRPILQLINQGGDPLAVDLATSYLQILFLGTPLIVLNIIIDRLMQGAGDTVTPLILNSGLNLFNILFNYLMMFGVGPFPELGLDGAAVGTLIARGIGLTIGLSILYSGRNVVKITAGTYWPNSQLIRDILTIGVPSGIQGVFRNGSRLLTIGIITSTEVATYGVAALAIGVQVESLAFMPVLGINVAATSLVGQSLGKWQTEEAWRRGNTSMVLGIGLMILLATPMIIFAPQIINLFDPSAQPILAEAGTAYLRINTVVLPFNAISMVANGAMRGAGDSMPGMIGTIAFRAVTAVALAYLLAFPLGFGSNGVWWALAISVVLNGIYMLWHWRRRLWEGVALQKTALYRQHLHHLSAAVQTDYLDTVRAPLMAVPNTLEVVDEQGVVYKQPNREVRFKFEHQSFKIV